MINANYSIFFIQAGVNKPIISTFINNIKIMALKNSNIIIQIKSKLAITFSIINMESISFDLGLIIDYDQSKLTIKLLQLAYINKIFNKFYFDKTYAVMTLIKNNFILKTKIKCQAFIAK